MSADSSSIPAAYSPTRVSLKKNHPKKTKFNNCEIERPQMQGTVVLSPSAKSQFRRSKLRGNPSFADDVAVPAPCPHRRYKSGEQGRSGGYLTRLKIGEDGWSSEYPSINSLLRHLARKSRSVASRATYCNCVMRFCDHYGTTPDELLNQDRSVLEAWIQDFTGRHEKNPRYANDTVKILKIFFRENGVNLRYPHYYVPPRFRKIREYIPTPDEVLKMAECAGSLRDRAIILALASSGLRNSTLRALKYGVNTDPNFSRYTIKSELLSGKQTVIVMVHEGMKEDIPTACKGRIPYYTFFHPIATEALRRYLDERRRQQGNIADDEFLFHSTWRGIPVDERPYRALTMEQVERLVKETARRAGLEEWMHVRPHSLRKTFDSMLRNQPPDSRLDTKDQEFLMGHILPGSQDAYYDRGKVEEMREKFSRLKFGSAQSAVGSDMLQELAEIFQLNLEDITSEARVALGREPDSSELKRFLQEKVRQKLAGARERKQEIIREEDLPKYLNNGGEVKTVLPSGKIVVEIPINHEPTIPQHG